ncbi:MAG TPA: hypothetical protein VJ919_11130 [Tangfeifania sp.]|nr:hypothetical protein [Tangfeifania sp.]
MKIDNKIDNAFGRTAVFVGGLFLLAAASFIYFEAYLAGVVVQIISLFVIFSYSGVEINTDKKQIRQYNKLFGIIKVGPWKSITAYRGVTLIPFVKSESMASWSNRTTTQRSRDYRIFIVSKARKPAFAIKCCKSIDEATDSLDEFSIWLKLPVFTARK